MRNIIALFLIIFLPSLLLGQTNTAEQTLVLSRVTVIDMTGSPPQSDMTVVITGNRIVALGKTSKISVPKNAQAIDATGKFLIPGLWDMHVHILFLLRQLPDTFFPLFVANGVTSVRDMHGDLESFNQFGNQPAQPMRPRVVGASLIVDGPRPLWAASIAVNSAEDGRKAVLDLKKRGANFVKTYSLIPRDAFFAIADESKKQGIPFAGHVPVSVTAAEASDAGIKSMEHLLGVLLGCSTEEDKLRKNLLDEIVKADYSQDVVMRRLFFAPPEEILDTYSEERATKLFARFARNNTWQVPSLVVWRGEAFAGDAAFARDERLKYVPRSIRESWNPQNSDQLRSLSSADIAYTRKLYERYFPLVGAMRRAGVPFMVERTRRIRMFFRASAFTMKWRCSSKPD